MAYSTFTVTITSGYQVDSNVKVYVPENPKEMLAPGLNGKLGLEVS